VTKPPPIHQDPRVEELEDALGRSEERTRLAESIGSIGTYEFDVATGLLFCSKRLKEIVGVCADGPLDAAKELLPRLHSEDRAAFVAAVERALASPDCAEHEIDFRIVRDDGEVRWLRNAGQVIFAESGGERRPLRAIGSVIDLTATKPAAEAAHRRGPETEQLLARSDAIFRQMTEGLVIFDAEGYLLDMNSAALAIHGFESVESLRRHLHSLADTFELSDLEGRLLDTRDWPIARALRGETFTAFEVRVRVRETGRIWIGSYAGTPVYGPGDELALAIVTLRDVSNQKATEAALAQAKARIEVALTATEVGVWYWEVRHDLVLADANLLRLFGLGGQERELPLERFLACIHPDDRERVKEGIENAIARTGPHQEDYRVVHPDGEVRWIHARGRVETDHRGVPMTFPGVAVDVTERRRADEALQGAQALLGAITGETEDLIAAEDGEFRYLFVNSAYQREFRRLWGRDIAVGDSMLEALAAWPVDQQKARELWGRALGGERFSVTAEFGPGGREPEVYDLHFNPIHDDRGRPIGAAHILRNVTERMRAQRVLQESEQFLRRVLDQLFAFVGVLDLDGTVRQANRAPLEAAGITAADVVGRKFWDCHWWSYSPAIQARLKIAVARVRQGDLVRFDVPIRVAGEGRMWIDFQLAPLRDGEGRVTHLIPSAMDITARKETDDALRESEARFRTMTDGLPLIVWVHDAEGRQVFVNRTFCEFFGVDEAEAAGEGWQLLMHPEDAGSYTGELLDCVRAGRPFHAETRARAADGEWRWLESWGQPRLGPSGDYLGFVGTSADVTDRKRAEEERRRSDARYRELVHSANSAILRWTRDGTITYFNEYAERLFGYRAEEVVGGPVTLLVPDTESTGRDLSGLITDIAARPEHYEHTINENLCRDGRRLWMVWTNKPVLDAQGRFVEMLCVGSDITELKRAEAALQEADRRKDEFLATLAHELRNPLAPIRTGVDLLQRLGDDRATCEQVLAMMDRQLGHLVHLVDDLLDVSRITRGKIELHREQLDLAEIVESALEMSEITRGDRRLTVSLPDEPLPLKGDRVRLVQAVCNLVNNAAKFTDQGGRIWIDARRREDQLQLSVRDNGEGIPPQQLSQVFEMFSQAHPGRGGGLGIGLTLVRSLIEMHGGSVSVRSEGLKRGAEFTLTLPLDRDAPVAEAPPAERERGCLVSRRVLVVDDNKDIADALGMVLRILGAETLVVYEGAAALAALPEFRPHVMLLDIGMPGMDGYEVARQVRARQPAGEPRLIAVTGWGAEGDRRRIRAAGFDQHLVKPVGVEKLRSVVGAD
jgi:PAS domain S-box-containing protein